MSGTRGAVRARVPALAVALMMTLPGGATATASTAGPPGPSDGVERRDVTFSGDGGLALRGTITAPVRAPGRLPAMVIVHGSGTGRRGSHDAEAAAFARAGIVTLTYDKRSVGYEQTSAGYDRLATDALAGLHVLQAQPMVEPTRVGLWGLSEGGWVVPIAASRSTDVAFAVLVGASALPPRRQQEWNERTDLLHAGVRGSLVRAKADQLAKIGASLPGVPRADHDPLPPLRRMHQPVLAVWAAQDRVVPPAESAGLLRRALDTGGDRQYTVRFIPGAEHTLHRSPDGFVDLDDPAPQYLRLVVDWVDHPATGPSADPPPAQATASVPMPPPAWWETLTVQGILALVVLLVFLSHPVLVLARGRTRPSRTQDRLRRPAAVLAGAGLATTAGLVAYLYLLVGADADELGPLLAGRPLPWLGLQLLSGVTLVATALVAVGVAVGLSRRRGERVQLSVLVVGGVLFVLLASSWGLLAP